MSSGLSMNEVSRITEAGLTWFSKEYEISKVLDVSLLSVNNFKEMCKEKNLNYIEELQNKSVFLNEIDYYYIYHIALYFCLELKPSSFASTHDIINFEQSEILPIAEKSHLCQLLYIKHDCPGCKFHHRHYIYDKIKKIRTSGKKDEYRLKLEFSFIYSFYKNMITKFFLRNMLQVPMPQGAITYLNRTEVIETLENKIAQQMAIWLGLFVPSVKFTESGNVIPLTESELREMQSRAENKNWKDYWGDRYEELLRQSKLSNGTN